MSMPFAMNDNDGDEGPPAPPQKKGIPPQFLKKGKGKSSPSKKEAIQRRLANLKGGKK